MIDVKGKHKAGEAAEEVEEITRIPDRKDFVRLRWGVLGAIVCGAVAVAAAWSSQTAAIRANSAALKTQGDALQAVGDQARESATVLEGLSKSLQRHQALPGHPVMTDRQHGNDLALTEMRLSVQTLERLAEKNASGMDRNNQLLWEIKGVLQASPTKRETP